MALYRDTLGLVPFRDEPGRLAWFRTGDSTELPMGRRIPTTAFGDRPCVGLIVDVDGDAPQRETARVEFLCETQRHAGRAWAHHRGQTKPSSS